MDNPYKEIYPGADWTYTYECPQCGEPVPLSLDPDSAPFYRELLGYCLNCHLDIQMFEEDFEKWKKNQRGELTPKQEDSIGDSQYHEKKCKGE